MTGVALRSTRAGRFQARLVDTAAWLAGVQLPASAGWLRRAREAALDRLRAMGLPEKRDEYWRYTDPARLLANPASPVAMRELSDEAPAFAAIERLTLVFVDGVFDAAQSDDPTAEGLEICRLSEAGQADIHWAQDVYGVLEAAGQSPAARPMAALNTATATDGVLIRATAAVDRPVSLVYLRRQPGAEMALHHVLRVEPGATLTLLESGAGAARSNVVVEADLTEGATLHHVRSQGRDPERIGLTHVFARVATGATLKSFTLSVNGALVRNETVVWMQGSGGSAHIAGAALGDGAFHHDDTVFITHQAAGCESRQVFKKVLHGGAVGVFQGKILVERAAQLTDGYQLSQALLMDQRSQFLAKPELEIYADDVKCSHGSTSGELDADQMFYLRSRGLPEDAAKRLLILAFLAEPLGEIARDDLAEELRATLHGWLERHGR